MSGDYSAEVVRDAGDVGIHVYRWRADAPNATVQIAHGAGEHALRWTPVAEALVQAGYDVVSNDHRGHGKTGEEHLGLSALGPRSTRAAIDVVQLIGQRERDERGKLPLILLGHSWGSLMAQKVIARSRIYDGAVLSGSSLAVPGILNIGDLNKRWRGPGSTGLEWLSRDPAVGEAFAADPYCFDIADQPVWTPLQAFAFLGRPPRRMPRDLPILIQSGTDDSLGGTRGATMLRDAYRTRSKLTDLKLRLYRGARHEIYNELNRDEVIADLIAWLDARFAA